MIVTAFAVPFALTGVNANRWKSAVYAGSAALGKISADLTDRQRRPTFKMLKSTQGAAMKRTVFLVCAFAALGAYADDQTHNPSSVEAKSIITSKGQVPADDKKIEEVKVGKVTYSGIAVQLARTDNVLELFDPLAPVRYGTGEYNLVRDPISGKSSGLKFLSISF